MIATVTLIAKKATTAIIELVIIFLRFSEERPDEHATCKPTEKAQVWPLGADVNPSGSRQGDLLDYARART